MIEKKKNGTYQAHKAWNKYYPDDQITRGHKKGEGFVIHHIDENNQNNAKENLMKLTPSEHAILHNKTRTMSDTTKAAISKANKGHKRWLGKNHSEKTRKKMSESRRGENHSKVKLNEQIVRTIREDYEKNKIKKADLARRYGVGWQTIHEIIIYKNWKHI